MLRSENYVGHFLLILTVFLKEIKEEVSREGKEYRNKGKAETIIKWTLKCPWL